MVLGSFVLVRGFVFIFDGEVEYLGVYVGVFEVFVGVDG